MNNPELIKEIITEITGSEPHKIFENGNVLDFRYNLSGDEFVKYFGIKKRSLKFSHDYSFLSSNENSFSISILIENGLILKSKIGYINACRGISYEEIDSDLLDFLKEYIRDFIDDGFQNHFCEKAA